MSGKAVKKKRGQGRAEDTNAFLLRTCHISVRKGGGRVMLARRGEEGETLHMTSTLFLAPGYFSGTFLQVQLQKELVGGVVNLFPMYTLLRRWPDAGHMSKYSRVMKRWSK